MILQNALFVAQNQAIQGFQPILFSLKSLEDINKMNTQTAQPAQNFPNTQNKSGLFFLSLFSLALWLAYAVNQGLIVEGVIYADSS